MGQLRHYFRVLLAGGLLVTLGSTFPGCGGDDSADNPSSGGAAGADASSGGAGQGGTGGTGGTAGDAGSCKLAGQSCSGSAECCSANCDSTLNTCTNPVGGCKAAGDSCTAPTECCTLVCDGGKCGATLCTSDQQPCTSDAQCCSGSCGSSGCEPLNTACKTAGNTCGGNSECCSQVCSNGVCAGKVSFCTQTNDICANDTDCCAGICTKKSGASVGVCTEPNAPGTTGCMVAGIVCGAGASGEASSDAGIPACGGSCCSRACAPYGPTGVFVCQPPSGCRPTGEVCVDDTDCCGSPGMPGGNGSVKCSKSPGEPVGRCDNGTACRPSGAVCKLAAGSCNAENNCCAGNVNQDPSVCQQDNLGIPRCTGAGDCKEAGSKAGQPCASSADCCGLPCLPNSADGGSAFICGGSDCVPTDGACTSDADCCSGLPCVAPPGSTKGSCGPPPVIPDAGPDSGPQCALYGQNCTQSSDCCNNVPCTNGKCYYEVF